MRIKFSGSIPKLDPILLIYPTPGTYSFLKADYPDHTIYEVMVIGAGGGRGGDKHGTDTDSGNETYAYGGSGGGGGFQRKRGALELLDTAITIIVGAAGADGSDGSDGDDGEFSEFGDIAIAGGGAGGKYAHTLSPNSENSLANGGSSGVGGQSDAGGHAAGGVCKITVEDISTAGVPSGTPGANGKLVIKSDSWVGAGGGGGAGGMLQLQDGIWVCIAPTPTPGGKGSYNLDELVSSFGTRTQPTTPVGTNKPYYGKGGKGGGARATPLNKSMRTYGDSGVDGAVIILLTVT